MGQKLYPLSFLFYKHCTKIPFSMLKRHKWIKKRVLLKSVNCVFFKKSISSIFQKLILTILTPKIRVLKSVLWKNCLCFLAHPAHPLRLYFKHTLIGFKQICQVAILLVTYWLQSKEIVWVFFFSIFIVPREYFSLGAYSNKSYWSHPTVQVIYSHCSPSRTWTCAQSMLDSIQAYSTYCAR